MTPKKNVKHSSLADYENVNNLLENMADSFVCDSKLRKMKSGVKRKINHAIQILTGYSKANDSTIKKRHQNWQTFVQSQ